MFQTAGKEEWSLITTNYVVQETAALVQTRPGWDACDHWLNEVLCAVQVELVPDELHKMGMARWRQARARNLSLTDCVSFAFLEQEGIRDAIVFDRHFAERGIGLPKRQKAEENGGL